LPAFDIGVTIPTVAYWGWAVRNGGAKQPLGKRITYWTITLLGISAVLLIVFIIALAAMCTRPPSKAVGLNASVTFDSTQFVVVNKDNFDWTEVKMEVNGGLISPGFSSNLNKISAGETRTVPYTKFLNLDNTQFNPSAAKIQRFEITCQTPKGEGSWSANYR
jgi:hypothetical protein